MDKSTLLKHSKSHPKSWATFLWANIALPPARLGGSILKSTLRLGAHSIKKKCPNHHILLANSDPGIQDSLGLIAIGVHDIFYA